MGKATELTGRRLDGDEVPKVGDLSAPSPEAAPGAPADSDAAAGVAQAGPRTPPGSPEDTAPQGRVSSQGGAQPLAPDPTVDSLLYLRPPARWTVELREDANPIAKQGLLTFWRDRPQLRKERPGQWVAYHGDRCLGFARTSAELYQRARQGLDQQAVEQELVVEYIGQEVQERFRGRPEEG
jgi:hypothetical protein